MNIEGQQTFAANAETLWSLLHDPFVLAKIIPGCELLESAGPHEYRLTLNTRLGQNYERLSGTLYFQRVNPFRGFDFVAEWTNREGSMAGRGRVVLESQEDGATTLSYAADIDAGGRFGQIAPRMMQTTVRSFTRRSLEALEKQVALRTHIFTTSTVQPFATTTTPDGRETAGQLRGLLAFGSLLLAIVLFWRGINQWRTKSANPPAATPE